MHSLLALNCQLQSIVLPKGNSILQQMALVAFGIIALAICAQISIPFGPIPFTLQTLAVLLVGMLYGPRLGGITICSYLFAGATGLPVFINMSSGLSGATIGYLIGFIPAAMLSGYLLQKGWARTAFTCFIAAIIADCIIFSLGYLGLASFVGWEKAYLFGVKPFVVSELLKLGMVAIIAPRFWKAS